MKKKYLYLAIILVLSFSTNVWAVSSIQAGADHLVDLQYTDGQWGWAITAPPTYSNTTGPIGLGLLSAYSQTGDSDHLDAAESAGDALVALTSDWVGTYNPLFLTELYAATGKVKYLDQAETFFSETGKIVVLTI